MNTDRKLVRRVMADNLLQCRYGRGWTRKEVSEKCGIPQTTLADAESGLANPSVLVIHQLALFYGVTLDQLLKPPDPEFAIGKRENLTRRKLPSGIRLRENLFFSRRIHYKQVTLPRKGSLRFPAGPAKAKEILICHEGDLWVQSKLDSRYVQKGQTLEIEAHLPKVIFGREEGVSRFTLIRVKL